jgi:hypothetical protein
MFWLFATAVLVLAVGSPGFRKFLKYAAIGVVSLWVLLWLIGAILG